MSEALYEAIIRGDGEEVQFLVHAAVNLNTAFLDGMYPLNTALVHCRQHIARILIDAGAHIDKADSFGFDECRRHPVHYAAANGCLEILPVLFELGVDVQTEDYGSSTPLHHAAANGHLPTVKYLVEEDSAVNHCSDSGRNALWKAAQNGYREVVHYLFLAGTDINKQNQVGATVLFDCAKQGQMGILKDLVDYGIDVNLRDIVGNTALHGAASLGMTNTVEALVLAGIDIDAVNENGSTALHNASKHNKVHTTLALLNFGAKWSFLNVASQSALYLAMLHTHKETTKLLQAVGAKLTEKELFMYEHFEAKRFERKELFFDWAKNTLFHQVQPLANLCRTVIIRHVQPFPMNILDLPLPPAIKQFLLLYEYLDKVPKDRRK